eukprot:4436607-Amphidinium_carterae.2
MRWVYAPSVRSSIRQSLDQSRRCSCFETVAAQRWLHTECVFVQAVFTPVISLQSCMGVFNAGVFGALCGTSQRGHACSWGADIRQENKHFWTLRRYLRQNLRRENFEHS